MISTLRDLGRKLQMTIRDEKGKVLLVINVDKPHSSLVQPTFVNRPKFIQAPSEPPPQ